MFPKLSDNQVLKLSDISSDIAIVAVASVALPAVLNQYDAQAAILGFVVTFMFWVFSLWLLK